MYAEHCWTVQDPTLGILVSSLFVSVNVDVQLYPSRRTRLFWGNSPLSWRRWVGTKISCYIHRGFVCGITIQYCNYLIEASIRLTIITDNESRLSAEAEGVSTWLANEPWSFEGPDVNIHFWTIFTSECWFQALFSRSLSSATCRFVSCDTYYKQWEINACQTSGIVLGSHERSASSTRRLLEEERRQGHDPRHFCPVKLGEILWQILSGASRRVPDSVRGSVMLVI